MIELETTGAGEPLVLLHGVGATRRVWRAVVPELASGRTVVAPDLPGFGGSPPVGPGFDLSEVADAVADAVSDALAARARSERFDLLGNSLGGAVAFVLARRHPDRVRRLILSAPAGFSPAPALVAKLAGRVSGPATIARGLAGGPLAGLEPARRVLLWGGIADPARLSPAVAREMLTASLRARRYGAAIAAVLRADLRGELPRLRVPVALLWGEEDRIVPVSSLAAIRAVRPEVPVVTLPGVAHVPQVEAPARFVTAVEDLLARLGR